MNSAQAKANSSKNLPPSLSHGYLSLGDGDSDWDQSSLRLNTNVLKNEISVPCIVLTLHKLNFRWPWVTLQWGNFQITPGGRPLARRHSYSNNTCHVAPYLKRGLHMLNENKAVFFRERHCWHLSSLLPLNVCLMCPEMNARCPRCGWSSGRGRTLGKECSLRMVFIW